MDTPMLEYAIITTEDALARMAGEWNELYARAGDGLFTDYDSFMVWWTTMGHGSRTLHVVTGRENGRLVGVVPLTVVCRKGLKIMQVAGHKGFANCEMLCEKPEYAPGLWEAARRSRLYHFADIRDVYPGTLCDKVLSSMARRRDLSLSIYMPVKWKTSKDWLASLEGSVRREFGRQTRRLAEKGTVTYHMYEGGPVPADVIDGLIRHKLAWCKENEKHGLFDHPRAPEFYRGMAEVAAKKGMLFLSWMTCGQDAMAWLFGYKRDGVVYGYVTTYDKAWMAYSPGNLAFINSMCWGVDKGMKEYDLRQGDFGYKFKYTDHVKECSEYTFSGTTAGRLIEAVYCGVRYLARVIKQRRLTFDPVRPPTSPAA